MERMNEKDREIETKADRHTNRDREKTMAEEQTDKKSDRHSKSKGL